VDPESPNDGKFTVRDRDTMQQERLSYHEFLVKMYAALEF
jgi:glycyl-tRNA synthetase (class II)